MSLEQEQARAYLEEARLSLEAAKASFDKAEQTQKELWHVVVKNSYDAMEQAVSAALAIKGEKIPSPHPSKITAFVNQFGESEITEILYKWLGKRGESQYVDVKEGRVSVPHKIFDKYDAKDALEDCSKVLDKIEKLLET